MECWTTDGISDRYTRYKKKQVRVASRAHHSVLHGEAELTLHVGPLNEHLDDRRVRDDLQPHDRRVLRALYEHGQTRKQAKSKFKKAGKIKQGEVSKKAKFMLRRMPLTYT